MLFNSVHFIIFLPIVLIIANYLKDTRQRLFLLIASFYFYMAWNYYFILLLLFSTIIDYFAGLSISKLPKEDKKRKLYLILSLVTNIGFLAYFKYTNFILGAFNDINVFNSFRFVEYNIILPVGISFYTFQSMSYTIDVYNQKLEARKSFLDFALYVAFFPQLVAGPIVRAETFFRDLDNRLPVDYLTIKKAFSQILVGFTKKVVFADNFAVCVDSVFGNYGSLSSLEVWTGVFSFFWQLYFDFGGYTDIAIGVARLFGFQFDVNFYYPLNVTSLSEHWSRWHISFTTWIRDYIFIPLGGSKNGRFAAHRNNFITFMFGGIWHGAAYHYVVWGITHSILLGIEREYKGTKLREKLNQVGGIPYKILCYILTILCIAYTVVLFRANNMSDAISIMKSMSFLGNNAIGFQNIGYLKLAIFLFIFDWLAEIYKLKSFLKNPYIFTAFIVGNLFLLLTFGVNESKNFIYFAF
ncbi:MAG: MBOAT family O-acyltransferase [Leptospiraceae bacterium]|nr:MBOAT family O-acyltransferase [Leptospiraceae bacterium]